MPRRGRLNVSSIRSASIACRARPWAIALEPPPQADEGLAIAGHGLEDQLLEPSQGQLAIDRDRRVGPGVPGRLDGRVGLGVGLVAGPDLGLELDPHRPDDVGHQQSEVAFDVAVVAAEFAGAGPQHANVAADFLVRGPGLGDPVQEQPVDARPVEDAALAPQFPPREPQRAAEAFVQRPLHRSNPGPVNDTRTGRVTKPGFCRLARRDSRLDRRLTASLIGIFATTRPAIW